jgi:hypothetical protein
LPEFELKSLLSNDELQIVEDSRDDLLQVFLLSLGRLGGDLVISPGRTEQEREVDVDLHVDGSGLSKRHEDLRHRHRVGPREPSREQEH